MKDTYLLLLLLVLLVTNCKKEFDFSSNCSNTEDNEKKVLLIGIDGLRADALQRANTPHLDALKEKSVFTYSCRIDSTNVLSGPNWSTIITGVWSRKHLVKGNFFVRSDFDTYPDFLYRIKDNTPVAYTAVAASWERFLENAFFDVDFEFAKKKDDKKVEEKFREQLELCDFDAGFIHFLEVDNVGHNSGFDPNSKKYIEQIEETDDRVETLMKVIHNREESLQEDWLVIIATDHGGVALSDNGDTTGSHKGHGDKPEVKHVPLFFYNKNFKKQELETTAFIVDIAPTILSFLEIPIDSTWNLDGKPINF